MSDNEIIDVDAPTPPEELAKAEESTYVPRELGEAHRVLLEIFHPKDENPEYVVRVTDPDSGELYGTLFSHENHVDSSFGAFIKKHIERFKI